MHIMRVRMPDGRVVEIPGFRGPKGDPGEGPDIQTGYEDENLSFGSELVSDAGWTVDGWQGNVRDGFTHVTGNTSPLCFTMPEDTAANFYCISFRCSQSIAVDALRVRCGNSDLFDLYGQAADPIVLGIQAPENGRVEFVPSETFNGRVWDISIRRILDGVLPGKYTVTDSQGELALELRATSAKQNNVFIGRNAGARNLSGYGNAAVGSDALGNNTSGFWNIGVGHNALRENTVGSRNVAVGYIALQDNICGIRNVAIGSFALHSNKTGNKNIAIGADCMNSNVDGYENVAIGLQALYQNVSGYYNTAIGAKALTKNTGNKNTGIGYSTLGNCSSGENNVGIGSQAGYNITTGKNNTAIGPNSLYKVKTGTGNIGIGAQAGRGQGVTTGFNYGVFIGDQAGYSLCDGANYNIMLGYKAGYDATTGTDNIVIGRLAGTGMSTHKECIFIGCNTQAKGDSDKLFGWLNIGDLIEGRMSVSNVNAAYVRINGGLEVVHLPTADPAVSGRLWNDNGTVRVSAG